jgi:hypothetical protein
MKQATTYFLGVLVAACGGRETLARTHAPDANITEVGVADANFNNAQDATQDAESSDDGGGEADAALPACSWTPPTLASDSGFSQVVGASRTLLLCGGGNDTRTHPTTGVAG